MPSDSIQVVELLFGSLRRSLLLLRGGPRCDCLALGAFRLLLCSARSCAFLSFAAAATSAPTASFPCRDSWLIVHAATLGLGSRLTSSAAGASPSPFKRLASLLRAAVKSSSGSSKSRSTSWSSLATAQGGLCLRARPRVRVARLLGPCQSVQREVSDGPQARRDLLIEIGPLQGRLGNSGDGSERRPET